MFWFIRHLSLSLSSSLSFVLTLFLSRVISLFSPPPPLSFLFLSDSFSSLSLSPSQLQTFFILSFLFIFVSSFLPHSHTFSFFLPLSSFSAESLNNNSPIRWRTSQCQKWVMTLVFFFAIHATQLYWNYSQHEVTCSSCSWSPFSGFCNKEG